MAKKKIEETPVETGETQTRVRNKVERFIRYKNVDGDIKMLQSTFTSPQSALEGLAAIREMLGLFSGEQDMTDITVIAMTVES